jgi:hypothetical protein
MPSTQGKAFSQAIHRYLLLQGNLLKYKHTPMTYRVAFTSHCGEYLWIFIDNGLDVSVDWRRSHTLQLHDRKSSFQTLPAPLRDEAECSGPLEDVNQPYNSEMRSVVKQRATEDYHLPVLGPNRGWYMPTTDPCI